MWKDEFFFRIDSMKILFIEFLQLNCWVILTISKMAAKILKGTQGKIFAATGIQARVLVSVVLQCVEYENVYLLQHFSVSSGELESSRVQSTSRVEVRYLDGPVKEIGHID